MTSSDVINLHMTYRIGLHTPVTTWLKTVATSEAGIMRETGSLNIGSGNFTA